MADTLTRRAKPKSNTVVDDRQTDPPPSNPLARCQPRGDRVVVQRDVCKRETKGGILLPDSFSNSKQQTGTVWSVGPGNYDDSGNRIPVDLKKGDRVIITGYAGLEIKDPINTGSQDDEFVMLREEDILAVLE